MGARADDRLLAGIALVLVLYLLRLQMTGRCTRIHDVIMLSGIREATLAWRVFTGVTQARCRA